MDKIRKFMIGRYGGDKLSFVLLIGAMLLSFVSSILGFELGMILSYVPSIWGIFRVFSKNIYKRAEENRKFLRVYAPIERKVVESFKLLIGTKTHKHYRCAKCKQIIRIPRGRGKLCITCPKCKHEFIKNT